MDPRTHQRYLDYLELRKYFARGDLPKLDLDNFVELDRELIALVRKEDAGECDAEDIRKLAALRRMLLRD